MTTWKLVLFLMLPPVASFDHAPLEPEAGQLVIFDAGDSRDPYVLGHLWDFGDDTPPREGDATSGHAFERPGTYTVTLTVIRVHGLKVTTTRTITVSPPAKEEERRE